MKGTFFSGTLAELPKVFFRTCIEAFFECIDLGRFRPYGVN